MPVLFRGRSEYDRNYKWNPSFRSASFEPKFSQTKNDAGLRSDEIGFTHGPRITSKKKVWHREPQLQSYLVWWPDSDSESQSAGHRNGTAVPRKQEGSPLIKAFKQKESENKMRGTSKKTANQRSQSLDGSYTDISKARSQRNATNGPAPRKNLRSAGNQVEISKNIDSKSRKVQAKSSQVTKSPPVKKEIRQSKPSPKAKPSSCNPSKSTKRETPNEERKYLTSSKKPKQEAANISLQHRAGLHVGKPSRQSRAMLSEYQRNFIFPKFPAKPSPLLSALDVVHSSSPAIPPHCGLKLQKTSEYNENYSVRELQGSSKQSPSKILTSPASPSMKAKVKDIQKPFYAPPAKKNLKSEYAAQYEVNKDFQVKELRDMAENNKQKHEGTHIDPNHASQVMSPLNKLWEASSDGSADTKPMSETVSKKLDENAPEESEPVEEHWSQASQKGSDTVTGDTGGGMDTEIEADSLDGESPAPKDLVARKLAWVEKGEESPRDVQSEVSDTAQSSLEGRITTPRLQEMGGALRTHLDLTTPCIGGALLSSPIRPTASTGSFISSKNSRPMTSPVAGSPTYDAQQLLAGRPHPLTRSVPHSASPSPEKHRPASAKEPLIRKESPKKGRGSSSTSPLVSRHTAPIPSRVPIRGALKNEEFQHCGPLGSIRTAPIISHSADEDALSVASSLTSARATELLKRAKGRKSFWTTA